MAKKVKQTRETLPISAIKPNPDNPRTIKDHRFKLLVKSIKEMPEMVRYRPIVVDENNMVLGGNMRLKAFREAGVKETEVIKVLGLNDEKKREFLIKDNANYGVWDWDLLANNWQEENLNDWGLNIWTPTLENTFSDEPEPGLSTEDVKLEREKKKVIVIEFTPDDYEIAIELYEKAKKNGINIPALFNKKLTEELC